MEEKARRGAVELEGRAERGEAAANRQRADDALILITRSRKITSRMAPARMISG
jgi:hypothetical protein